MASQYEIEAEQDRQYLNRQPHQSAIQDDYVVESSTGNHSPLSTSQCLKVNFYFPVIDDILSEMGRRFSEKHMSLMISVQACDPTSPHFLEVTQLKSVATSSQVSTCPCNYSDGVYATETIRVNRRGFPQELMTHMKKGFKERGECEIRQSKVNTNITVCL